MPEAERPIAVLVDREGLGDVLLKTPFLRALRRAFPANDVWWLADHQTAMAGDLRAFVGEGVVNVVPDAGLIGATGAVLSRLRALPPFERVFDTRTRIYTVALARFALRHRGFYCCLPGHFLCDGGLAVRPRPRHVSARLLSLIACAHGQPADGAVRLEASAEACEQARLALPDGPTYVGFAPGSRQDAKNWPFELYLQAAQALVAHGVTPVFILGPFERHRRSETEKAGPGVITLTQDPDASTAVALDRLIAWGQRLSLLVANDNGVGHLLGGAGVPVVSLFGPTDPARWAPVAPANMVLRASTFAPGHRMAAIPVTAVVDAVMTMLDGLDARRGPASGGLPPALAATSSGPMQR